MVPEFICDSQLIHTFQIYTLKHSIETSNLECFGRRKSAHIAFNFKWNEFRKYSWNTWSEPTWYTLVINQLVYFTSPLICKFTRLTTNLQASRQVTSKNHCDNCQQKATISSKHSFLFFLFFVLCCFCRHSIYLSLVSI